MRQVLCIFIYTTMYINKSAFLIYSFGLFLLIKKHVGFTFSNLITRNIFSMYEFQLPFKVNQYSLNVTAHKESIFIIVCYIIVKFSLHSFETCQSCTSIYVNYDTANFIT